MAKKKQVKKPKDEGKIFMQRLQKNLEYFKQHRPDLYKMLSGMELRRVELVVTPGRDDVDMVANGKSCYRGLAREYSLEEAEKVLIENPVTKRIETFAPPSASAYGMGNFADYLLRETINASPIEPGEFKGYIRGNIFPSLVFLGCGLGYHIEALADKASIINAIVIEREPEKFAVSLYTVDWAKICSRFSRKGQSITFAIGKADAPAEIKRLVSQHLARDLPFYPFFSTYYSHLADVELAKGVFAAAKDLAVITAHWSSYDNELLRLSNTAHNTGQAIRYIPRRTGGVQDKPLVVVGSGPSLDKRVESLKAIRDKVVLVSAGTGLRPLLAYGLRPDYHAELDPSHLIYRLLSDIGKEKIKDIPLLAVNEVNPYVPGLFDNVFYYFKSDNSQPAMLGLMDQSFNGCNPTVTNAALAIGHVLGFRKIYLFGTDYGYESQDKDHSSKSVYGDDTDSELAVERREQSKKSGEKKRPTFTTPAVNGGTVLTQADYYSAKRSVEELIHTLGSSSSETRVFNCSDGAVIEGADWLSEQAFLDRFDDKSAQAPFDALEFFEARAETLESGALTEKLPNLHQDIVRVCQSYERTVRTTRLQGRRDLCQLVNQIRQELNVIRPLPGRGKVTGTQMMTAQLLKGSLLHFLYVGICHGMASEDAELVPFLKTWQENFVEFLRYLPGHFSRAMLDKPGIAEDPWAHRDFRAPDPEYPEFLERVGQGSAEES